MQLITAKINISVIKLCNFYWYGIFISCSMTTLDINNNKQYMYALLIFFSLCKLFLSLETSKNILS